MEWQARMFSRGRVTVPRELLRKMRVRPGDNIEFKVKEDGAYAHIHVKRTKASRKRKPF